MGAIRDFANLLRWVGLRVAVCSVALVAILMVGAGPAAAAPLGQITEFTTGANTDPGAAIAVGADGNLWFPDLGSTPAIGRITTSGALTEFSAGLNPGSSPESLAAGPDGNLWFIDDGTTVAIGRITPSGSITEFSTGLNPGSVPDSIAAGPDGNLWFTDEGSTPAIGRITLSGTITEFSTGLNTGSSPYSIAAGPDGNLWFTDLGCDLSGTCAIGRITSSGTITEFSTGLNTGSIPARIAGGPDGNVWFTDQGSSAKAIGRITPSGTITEFSAGLNTGSSPNAIASGPDGDLWFTDIGCDGSGTCAIGQITPTGTITEFSTGLNTGSSPNAIVAGPDDNMWFTDSGSTAAIGQIGTGATTATQPSNTSAPTGYGSAPPTVGQQFTGSAGGWSGTQPISYAYTWLRCPDTLIADCAVASQSSPSANTTTAYTLQQADVDDRMLLKVIASNSAGQATEYTASFSGIIEPAPTPPSNTSVPIVAGSGSPAVGEQFTGSAGSWSGTQPISYTYRWLRCPNLVYQQCSTASQSGPSASTTASYRLQQADIGDRMRLEVTATNAAGQATADGGFSGIIEPAPTPPSNTSVPIVAGSGSPAVGEQFTGSAGSWSGTQPISYTYRWLRCPNLVYQQCSTASQSGPSASTTASYRLQQADIGDRMRLEVTATNAAGQATADGGFSGVIAPFPGAPVPTWGHPITMPAIEQSSSGVVRTVVVGVDNPTSGSTASAELVPARAPTPQLTTAGCSPGTYRWPNQTTCFGLDFLRQRSAAAARAGASSPFVFADASRNRRDVPPAAMTIVRHVTVGVVYLRISLSPRARRALLRHAHNGIALVKVVTELVPSASARHAKPNGAKLVQRTSTIKIRLTPSHHSKHHKRR